MAYMVFCKANFKSSHSDLQCDLCQIHVDSQENFLLCEKLENSNCISSGTLNYQDLFSPITEEVIKISLILQQKFEKRKILIAKKENEDVSAVSAARVN